MPQHQKRIEITPAILEGSLDAVADKLALLRGKTPRVQVDVVDGIFAPNRTWPFAEPAQREEFERVASQEEALPLWEDFDFEFDLMLAHPHEEAQKWVAAGASGIVIHAASAGAREALEALQESRGGEYALSLCIALAADDEAGAFAPFMPLCDLVQVMGIERVGFQHQTFDARALRLITQLRERYPEVIIQVDGGVSLQTAHALAQAGANRLIAGSAVFTADDPVRELEELRAAANAGRAL